MNMRYLSAFFLSAFLVLSAPSTVVLAQTQAQSSATAAYRLGSGDEIRVTVFGHKDLSGDFTVDGSGFVSLPLVGNVAAGGLALRDFERNIIKASFGHWPLKTSRYMLATQTSAQNSHHSR